VLYVVISSYDSSCAQGTLKDLEASLKKLESQKEGLVEANMNLKSTGEVLQNMSRVQDEASEHLERAADTNTGQGEEENRLDAETKMGEVRLCELACEY
jgi:hypothetical protein